MFRKIVVSVLVFSALAFVGMKIAANKLLWNDELWTQTDTIDKKSYVSILKADFPEGNLSPLFYIVQKGFCQMLGYKFQFTHKGEFCIYEPNGQVILRIMPVIYMALSVAVFFLYFLIKYSYGIGFLGLGLMLSSFSVWAFIAEARPYSLIFLLCTLQTIAFLELVSKNAEWKWKILIAVHFLQALTFCFNVIPIFAVSAGLAVIYPKEYLKRSFLMTVIPVLLCAFYYWITKNIYGNLAVNPLQMVAMIFNGLIALMGDAGYFLRLLSSNVSINWLIILLVGSVSLLFIRKFNADGLSDPLKAVLLTFGISLAGSFSLIAAFLAWKSFMPAERYLVFLTPMAAASVVLMINYLLQSLKTLFWWRVFIVAMISCVIFINSIEAFFACLEWGPLWSI